MKTPQEQLNELAERDVLYGQPGCEPVGLFAASEPVPKNHWRCHRCNTVNKNTHRFCDGCYNEPTAGRRDVDPEGRKYDPDQGY